MTPKTAYVTGGASGIGLAVAHALNQRGMRVIIADINLAAAQEAVDKLQQTAATGLDHLAVRVDVSSWESQVAAFEKAIEAAPRLDLVLVNAGIGEEVFVPNDGGKGRGFVKPNLGTLDIDLTGFLYTSALAIQQMRRQEIDADGLRGRIIGTASVCGFYCVPTLPVYTAAKHGAVGFVRSYGKHLPEEHITLNAICPHVVRTNMSTPPFYNDLQDKDLLTQMKEVVHAFMHFVDHSDQSGECLEIGPVGTFKVREAPSALNEESETLNGLISIRGRPLHEVVS